MGPEFLEDNFALRVQARMVPDGKLVAQVNLAFPAEAYSTSYRIPSAQFDEFVYSQIGAVINSKFKNISIWINS